MGEPHRQRRVAALRVGGGPSIKSRRGKNERFRAFFRVGGIAGVFDRAAPFICPTSFRPKFRRLPPPGAALAFGVVSPRRSPADYFSAGGLVPTIN